MSLIYKVSRKIIQLLLALFIRRSLFDYSNDRSLFDLCFNKLSSDEVNNSIYDLLSGDKPCMIARLGNTEINTLIKYDNFIRMNKLEKIYQWTKTSKYPFSPKCVLNNIHPESGFYPVNKASLLLFKNEMINSMQNVDILGSWVKGENRFQENLTQALICDLKFLEPYYHNNPWSRVLEGKNVLIIHPFVDTIKKQYRDKRDKLFLNEKTLPEFNAMFIKSTFTTPSQNSIYQDWFHALDDLYNNALSFDFDIAIIGCGAYGFPLASKLKSRGKKCIHLGGSTQLLFGIKGHRWEHDLFFKSMFNKFWVYPSVDEKPIDFKKMDNGCYW